MKKSRILIASFAGMLSVFAICACVIFSTNTNNDLQDNFQPANEFVTTADDNSGIAQTNEPQSQLQNNTPATNDVSKVRYVDQVYSKDVADSMKQIQNSYNEKVKDVQQNNIKQNNNNQNNTVKSGDMLPVAADNSFMLANNNSSNQTIYWTFDESSSTLHISGDSTFGYKHNFNAGETPTWKTGDTEGWTANDFYRISYVEIENNIETNSCFSWFGCVSDCSGQEVRLSNIENISGLRFLHNLNNASYMFAGCDLLNLSVEDLPDMTSVTDITAIFALTKSMSNDVYNKVAQELTTINNVSFAFANNEDNFTNLDVSSWMPGASSDISYLFYNCGYLQKLVGKASTQWVASNAAGMFTGCNSLVATDNGDQYAYNTEREKIESAPLVYACTFLTSREGLFTIKRTALFDTLDGETFYDYYPVFKADDAGKYRFYNTDAITGKALSVANMKSLNGGDDGQGPVYVGKHSLWVECIEDIPCTSIRGVQQTFTEAFGEVTKWEIKTKYVGGKDIFKEKGEVCSNLNWKATEHNYEHPTINGVPIDGDGETIYNAYGKDSYGGNTGLWSCVSIDSTKATQWSQWNMKWMYNDDINKYYGIVFSRTF